MERTEIRKGDRVKVGRIYGKAWYISAQGTLWYYADDGHYRFTQLAQAERVHGLKHLSK